MKGKTNVFKHLLIILCNLLLVCLLSSSFGQSSLTGQVIDISPGFEPDPLSYEYISGGPISVAAEIGTATDGNKCEGFIASEPDHTLVLRSDFPNLRIYIEASVNADTTMVIRSEDASLTICRDDIPNVSKHPSVTSAFTAGIYYIYVGSYEERDMINYTIFISE